MPEFVFHNLKFDAKWLNKMAGRPIRYKKVSDTMLMHYTIDERPMGQYSAHGLKDLSRIRFDAADYSFDWQQFYAIEKPERDDFVRLFRYQAKDCAYTLRLYDTLRAELPASLAALHDDLLIPASKAFAEIEAHGIAVDVPYVEKLATELMDAAGELRDKLIKTGAPLLNDPGFNPASVEQLKRLLYEVWKLPKLRDPYQKHVEFSTARDVVSRLAATTGDPVVADFLRDLIDWRQDMKMLRTYAEGLLKATDPDGRVRPSFILHGTSTGRLSCQEPNLQNIPNKIGKQIQHAFVASEGKTLVSCDFSQLEIRVLAWYSRDEELIRIFQAGEDIHSAAAQRIYNKPADKISDLERKLTKTIVFGVIYGRGPKSIVEGQEMTYFRQMGLRVWTIDEARAFQQKLLVEFPGLHEWIKTQEFKVITRHFVSTPIGRRRRFPFITPESRAEVMRQAVNMPVQSLASDVCLHALIRLHGSLPPGCHALLAIHDELIFEVPDGLLGAVVPSIVRTMQEDLPPALTGSPVPFKVTAKAGKRWSELTEWKA